MTDPNDIELENHGRMMVDDSTGISYLLREGAGRTIVMLHGIGSNAASFSPLFGALDEDAQVLAWNAPGYLGSSPLAAEWPTADDYAEALLMFVDGLKVDITGLVPRYCVWGTVINQAVNCLKSPSLPWNHCATSWIGLPTLVSLMVAMSCI